MAGAGAAGAEKTEAATGEQDKRSQRQEMQLELGEPACNYSRTKLN
jgi:hypothetical protein